MAPRPARDTSGEGTVPVEILDDGDPGRVEPAVARVGPTGRHRRWFLGLAVTALVAAVAVANIAEMRARAERRTALDAVVRVLEPPSGPRTEVWRVEDADFSGTVGDVVLVARPRLGTVAGVDAATGRERWLLEAPPGAPEVEQTCRPAAAGATGQADALGPDQTWQDDVDPADTRVVCVRRAVPPAPPGAVEDPVLVLDGTTGEVLSTVGGRLAVLRVAAVDGDLLVLQVDTERRLHAGRWDDLSGEELWRYRSPEPVFAPGALDLVGLVRAGDVLYVQSGRTVALDLRSGSARDAAGATAWTAVQREELPLAGHRTAVVETRASPPLWRGYVEDAAGQVLYDLQTAPLAPSVDDGSAPEVLVTGSAGGTMLLGLDPTTGERLWTFEHEGAGAVTPLVRIHGVLVVVAGARVHALDARTGSVLWDAPAHPVFPHVGMTDGDDVLVVVAGEEARHLVGYDLRDGAVSWRTALPAHAESLEVTSTGRLVLVEDDVVGLG